MQVTLRMVSKRFRENGVLALCDVDWALAPGGIHTIAGENGAGKSTLAQILGGFIRPDAGFIAIDGAVQQFSSPAAALAAGIGVIRQRPRAVGSFTVWENCVLGAEGAPPPPPPPGGGGGVYSGTSFLANGRRGNGSKP